MSTTLSNLADLVDRQFLVYGRETPLDGLLLTRAQAPSGQIGSVYWPSFCVVLQGDKTTMLGDNHYRYAAGQGLLASVDVPVTARITQASVDKPYLALSLVIDPAMVAALLPACGEMADQPFEPLRVVSLDPNLLDPLARLLSLLDSPRDLAVLAPIIRQEITWRLLSGPLAPTLRQVGTLDGRAARIGRVTAFIREHYAQPLRVADLAALAHMSAPSLHRHFKAVTTMSPVQFQKEVRLQEGRRRLIGAADVAQVGYAIGYESASQFSRDYRRLFGVPPGQDGRRMRTVFAPASEP